MRNVLAGQGVIRTGWCEGLISQYSTCIYEADACESFSLRVLSHASGSLAHVKSVAS